MGRMLHFITSSIFFLFSFGVAYSNDIVYPGNGFFMSPKVWYQLDNDADKGIFRSYSGFMLNSELSDFPNLFLTTCSPGQTPYFTMHFPENYRLDGLDAKSWLPKTNFSIKNSQSTFHFESELNENEFYIDLYDREFQYFLDIWLAGGAIDFKVGPEYSSFSLVFGSKEIDDTTTEFIKSMGKSVTGIYSFLQMETRCLANSKAGKNKNNWIVFGSIECPECTGNTESPIRFIEIKGNETNLGIKSKKECDKKKSQLEQEFRKNAKNLHVETDLLCIPGD